MKEILIQAGVGLLGVLVGFFCGIAYCNSQNEKLPITANDTIKLIEYRTKEAEIKQRVDTLKIYYKIKQNELKNDTTYNLALNRFRQLLTDHARTESGE